MPSGTSERSTLPCAPKNPTIPQKSASVEKALMPRRCREHRRHIPIVSHAMRIVSLLPSPHPYFGAPQSRGNLVKRAV